jgi:CheY-like chemotaxis protein
LTTALQLIAPMAAQHGVQVARSGPESGCLAAVNVVAARQVVLVLLTVALRHAQSSPIKVDMRHCGWLVQIAVGTTAQAPMLPALTPEDQESLDVVRHLVAPCGGRIRVQHEPGVLALVAEFPAVEQIPVLAIEDNADTVRLLERYLAGTCYRLQSVSRVEQALSLAARAAPRAIILDVVMPDIDGWESLQRLRQHPVTQDVPVLVCTILPEQELALSLGAADFVHKPFRRDELCRALDRLVDREAKAPPSPHGSR